ncbi:hypothetical protein HMPREF2128_04100 [Pseudoglutamicibacter albus DNF00011]|uniref:Uncharacterized protein n=2 Tax=Pseudoglutamicibacter albus TaxID=98671 RepID=A0A095YEQ3_9MICC|nr:hypothetical protein HMPREF2128_04100 [Pseudoglutamicibacter albus DNF00011]
MAFFMDIPDVEIKIPEHPGAKFRLPIPEDWEVDDSGSDNGVFIYKGGPSELWSVEGFRSNFVIIQRAYDQRHATEEGYYNEILATDAGLAEQLAEYRNIHLGWDTLGGDNTAAVLRVASYRNEEGTPVVLYQWNAIRDGIEMNVALTFHAALLFAWADVAYMWAKEFEWAV